MTSTPDAPDDQDPAAAPGDRSPGPPEHTTSQLIDQVRELGTQLAQLQIQHHPVLAQLASLAARLTTVEDRTEDIGAAMDAVEALLAALAAPAAAQAELWSTAGIEGVPAAAVAAVPTGDDDLDEEAVGLDLRRLVAWVRDNVALLLERKIPQTQGGLNWCRQWWQHAEAIARFEALRRCWTEAVASPEGAGMAVYFEHLDHHLAVLTAETGPFAHCSRGAHVPGRATPLGHDEPSERYFLDFDDIRDALAS